MRSKVPPRETLPGIRGDAVAFHGVLDVLECRLERCAPKERAANRGSQSDVMSSPRCGRQSSIMRSSCTKLSYTLDPVQARARACVFRRSARSNQRRKRSTARSFAFASTSIVSERPTQHAGTSPVRM